MTYVLLIVVPLVVLVFGALTIWAMLKEARILQEICDADR